MGYRSAAVWLRPDDEVHAHISRGTSHLGDAKSPCCLWHRAPLNSLGADIHSDVDGARGVLPEPVGRRAHRNPGHAGDRCVDDGANTARSRNPSEEDHSGRLAQAERRHCAPCRQMTHHGRRRIACGRPASALRASAANDQRDRPYGSRGGYSGGERTAPSLSPAGLADHARIDANATRQPSSTGDHNATMTSVIRRVNLELPSSVQCRGRVASRR